MVFQFQNGAIKSKLIAVILPDTKMFQFQNGAIKSQSRCRYAEYCEQFQFQNGAIKRNVKAKRNRITHYFNSKMVRLKALNRL